MIFEFKNVSLAYEAKSVLDNINFQIPQQEIIGILGPNGCGKTTLLKLMTGVLTPKKGSVELMGKNLPAYSRKQIAQLVSVLPQDTLLDFPFKALEIVLMGRSPYLKTFQWETAHDLKLAKHAMELTDCWHFAGQDIRLLSGGERERVLLARALTQEPQVLLLDEPTTHLDLKHQMETFRLLKKLNEEQKLTLVVVLHDLNFAAQICHRILLLGNTKLQAYGTPEEVLTSDKIKEIYGVSVNPQTHPSSKKPYFLPNYSSDIS